jgi:hypothetical protein
MLDARAHNTNVTQHTHTLRLPPHHSKEQMAAEHGGDESVGYKVGRWWRARQASSEVRAHFCQALHVCRVALGSATPPVSTPPSARLR